MEQLYSYKRAAELLDISVRTLKRLVYKNNLQIFYVSRSARLLKREVESLVRPVKQITPSIR